MNFYNFEYDGIRLSDMGYILCNFNSGGIETVSNGSEINFETVSILNGEKHSLIATNYKDCLAATFYICKNQCTNKNEEISVDELRKLMKWLNRKEFHEFRLIDNDYINYYFEASFNISKMVFGNKVVGLELRMITNRPFALHNPINFNIDFTDVSKKFTFNDISDNEGFIYPKMEIHILSNGDLILINEIENRKTFIRDCKEGEIIKFDYPLISTSEKSHKIQDDFNWMFFRIANKFNNNINIVKSNLPCKISMSYSPIIKISI